MATRKPTLTLCYLPHLDYDLQRFGPDLAHPRCRRSLQEVDALCGRLIEAAERAGRAVVVVSEYGITPVTDAVHINRALRRGGLHPRARGDGARRARRGRLARLRGRRPPARPHLCARPRPTSRRCATSWRGLDGVELVLDEAGKREAGLDHPRSGELVAISAADRWFSYYYWLDDERAPDYARTVDIHRKPGYDPVELFVDPAIRLPAAAIGWRLAKRKLGQRTLLDVISLKDTRLVKGSHGRLHRRPGRRPARHQLAPGAAAGGRRRRDGLQGPGARPRVPEDRVGLAKARTGRPWTD